MEKIFHKLSLDFNLEGKTEVIKCHEGDKATRFIEASFRVGGRPFSLDCLVSATIRAKTPSGGVVYNDCEITGDSVLAPITGAVSGEVGISEMQITLVFADSSVISSPTFLLESSEAVCSDEEIEGTNEFSVLERALNEIKELKNQTLTAPEHIVSLTTEEVVDKIIVSKDENGEDFCLYDSLTIYLQVPAAEKQANVSVFFGTEPAALLVNGKNTSLRCSRSSFYFNGRCWENYSVISGGNASNGTVNSIVFYENSSKVREISISVSGGFPVGTIVKVYGRREQIENND